MQIITITGRIGGNAETRQAGQNDVTNFNVAVDQGFGQDKTTNWYRVAIWGGRGGKLAPYILKGGKITVTGELVIGEYQGKPQFEIRCHDCDPFMGEKQTGNGGPNTDAKPAPSAFDTDLDDDVPFVTADPTMEARVG